MDGAAVATSLPREPINQESQIFIRICNRSIILNVNLASDSVEEVKRLVEEREGIPVAEQHLIFGGIPLQHGTFLRDYDALGHQCTLDVFARIRGNRTSWDMALRYLVDNHPSGVLITRNPQSIPMLLEDVGVQVLTEVGGRILHGVLTCILSAHRAGLAFGGACGMDNLMIHVYERPGTDCPLVVSRVYVRDRDDGLVTLDGESHKADYRALLQVMEVLFHDVNDSNTSLHVGSIYKLLRMLAAEDTDPEGLVTKDLDHVKRTHLLQAYAVMVSSPVAVSTMCLNLKRFYEQLPDSQKLTFTEAMRAAEHKSRKLVSVRSFMVLLFKTAMSYKMEWNTDGTPLSMKSFIL